MNKNDLKDKIGKQIKIAAMITTLGASLGVDLDYLYAAEPIKKKTPGIQETIPNDQSKPIPAIKLMQDAEKTETMERLPNDQSKPIPAIAPLKKTNKAALQERLPNDQSKPIPAGELR